MTAYMDDLIKFLTFFTTPSHLWEVSEVKTWLIPFNWQALQK